MKRSRKDLITFLCRMKIWQKLRHDYINQITVVNAVAVTEPQKAIAILDNMKREYEERLQI